MFVYRLVFRLTRVPYFLLLLLHLFGGSTWNISRRDGGGRRAGGRDGGAGARRAGGGGFARGQEFPSRDEGHFQFMVKHPEVVFDTKNLPDGKEETVYLDKEKPTRFFFVVEENAAILNLVVSPCSSEISWTFSFLYPTPNEGHDEGRDMEEEEEDEIFQQGKAFHSSSLSIKRNSSRLLKSYTGYDVSGFESENPDAGVYSLLLVNGDRDGSVRLFTSTSPQSVDSPFPLLPGDRKVRIISSSISKSSSSKFPFSSSASFSGSFRPSSTIHLTWKRSPTEAWHQQPIEYCLSVNNFRHLKTYCAARALALGDPRPTLPPYAGFGNTHQDQPRGTSRRKSEKGGRKVMESKQRVRLICVGSKTTFTFKVSPSALVNGRTIYFDVFAVNRRTQSSVTYEGVQLKPVTIRQQVKLKLDDVMTFRLKAPPDYMLFRFKVVRPPPKVLLFGFRACVSLVRVEISRDFDDDDEIVYENRTIDGRPLQFMVRTSAASPDSYSILVSNDGKGSASFQVSVTSATKDFPFPDIPVGAGIRVVQSDCHSLELSWRESSPGPTYHCLVVEPLHSTGSALNRCVIPRPSNDTSSRILCHPTSSLSNLDHRRQEHYQTVTDLERDLSYRLTVFVGFTNSSQHHLHQQQHISSYRPTITATAKECRSQIDRNNTEI